MGRRKVEVELVLDARNYLDETAKTLAATKAAEKELEGLGAGADKTGVDMEDLARNTDTATKKVGEFGSGARGVEADLKFLEARIASTKDNLAGLNVQWARTGDETIRTKIRQETALLRDLEHTAKAVADDIAQQVAAAGGRAGPGFFQSLAGAFSGGAATPGLGPILIGAAVAAAALAAPTIGAIIGGAVATGVGSLGLGVGLLAATHNPAVKDALSEFGGSIKTMFFESASTFSGRFIDALGILKNAFRDMDLDSTFKIVAPYITVVAKGIAGLATEFMPKFRTALEQSRPALEILAKQLPKLGDALGDFLIMVTRSKGIMMGLDFAFATVEVVLRAVGGTVEWLSNLFYDANRVLEAFTGLVGGLIGDNAVGNWFKGLSNELAAFIGVGNTASIVARDAADGIRNMGPPALSTSDAIAALTTKMDDALDSALALARASLDQKQAMADLTQSFIDNGLTLDENTQKGKNNWRAILDSIDATKRQRDEMIASGVNTATANIIYQQNIEKIQAQAKAAHESASQVNTLSDALRDVPKLTRAQLILQFEQSGTMLGEHSGQRIQDARASGGPVTAGLSYIVGDGGVPEVFTPTQNGYVTPSVPTYMANNAGGWQSASSMGGGALSPVNLTVNLVDSMTGQTVRTMLITDALNRNQDGSLVSAAYP